MSNVDEVDEDLPADCALTPADLLLITKAFAALSATSLQAAETCMELARKMGQARALERELRLMRSLGRPAWARGRGSELWFGLGWQ